MPRELRPFVRALRLQPATLAGLPAWRGGGVLAATVGVGPAMARRSAERLLEASGASGVLVIGVAGACDRNLRVADVVAPAVVVDGSAGTVFEPQPFLPGSGLPPRAGTLVTVERIGAAPPSGAAEVGADTVDMETAAVAAVCVSRSLPWEVLRAVSDVPGGLPAAIDTVLRPDGRADPVALVRLLARHPSELPALVRLGRDTSRAIAAVTAAALAALGANR